jgi:hypothetical protein
MALGAGDQGSDRVVNHKQATTASKEGASGGALHRFTPAMRRGCDLRCTQRVLLKLINKHNKLVKQFNKLKASYYNCEELRNVTQYSGYDYQGVPGASSALDFTLPGDPVSTQVVVWTC